jgi:hypothetical protein
MDEWIHKGHHSTHDDVESESQPIS